ncbi:MAG TPA: hypothetical protein VIF62_16505 [Labilithrix sp.]
MLVALAACTEAADTGSPAVLAQAPPPVAPPPPPEPIDASGDAIDEEAAASRVLTVYPRVGATTDDTTTPHGPGLVLDGGTLVGAALVWARDTLGGAPASSRAFDAVVVSATAGDQSLGLYGAAQLGSTQTLVLPPNAGAADFAAAAAIVDHAELVLLPGGEQNAYVAWKGTALGKSIQGVYDRGGVVVGTSAGGLVMGAFAFDAVAAGISENVTPEVALANPFDPLISFTRHMFAFPPLADAITEVHFEQRDRMGRLAMFMARQHADGAIARNPPFVLGIAVDEHAAIVIDKSSTGTLVRDADAARAFLVKGGAPTTCVPGQRLAYAGLEVHRLDDPSQTFDFTRWCGTAPVYTLDISADAAAPFGDASPYDRPATASACP